MRIEQGLLPDDYLDQRAERRTNVISLTLFVVVMAAVFAAFLVTNREWSNIKSAQAVMNEQYEHAHERIKELKELEQQREQMLNKAELATALVERVPRSILLAELINRMPAQLSLLEFDLKTEEVKARKSDKSKKEEEAKADKAKTKSLKDAQRTKTKEEAQAEARKVEAPKHQFVLSMIGVAPSDADVSKYIESLNQFPILDGVRLEFSEEKEIEGRWLRQFKISMKLVANADISTAPRLLAPDRPGDPLDDKVEINAGAAPVIDVESMLGSADGEASKEE